MAMTTRWVLLVVAASGMLAGAGPGAKTHSAEREQSAAAYKAEDGPLDVAAVESLTLRDGKRKKDLTIRVTYPKGKGPYPVIVWSHGATGTKDMYQPLARHWASHGYVCLQANHSDSRAFGEKSARDVGVFTDWRNRPRDVAFLLDSLEAIEKQVPALSGKMDRQTVGVGGHSFGAHTAQLVAGAATTGLLGARESHADPRPAAFLLLSPQGVGAASAGLDEDSWKDIRRPYLVITGTRDLGRGGQDWQWRLDPFEHASPGDKYALVIDEAWHGFGGIVGGGAFRGAGPDRADHRLYVKTAAIAFWDAFLKKEEKARAFLRSKALDKLSRGAARLKRKTGENEAPAPAAPAAPAATSKVETEDADWHDAKRDRTVPVRIYAPRLAENEGRLPAIVFSHGGGESREAFAYLGTHWAAHGYLVVFLTHRGSDRKAFEERGMRGLGSIRDFHLRPEDVRFVLDRLLSSDPGSKLLAGRVDPHRAAVAGQCAGSTTALAMVGLRVHLPEKKNVTFADPRFRCAVAMSPQMAAGRLGGDVGLHEKSWAEIRAPTMVVTGTRDFLWIPAVRRDRSWIRKPYDGLPPGEKYLVEIEGAEHNAFTDSEPYYPAGKRDPRHHGWIQKATTAFFDAHLKGDRQAAAWLRDGGLQKETEGACRQENKLGAKQSAAASGGPTTPKGDDGPQAGLDFTPVDEFLEKSLDRMGGGCCMLLIQGDRVVYRKAFGTFTLDTVVPIASASKWISGGVVMALVDEGKIALDDPASKYLPGFRGKKAKMTVRQMFSHTHGLPAAPTPHRNTRLTMAEAADQIAEIPLEFDPGTALLYSGSGMQAAGRICEIATGNKWVEIFEEEIAGPLEMENTHYDAFGRTENPNVAGSVATSVDDYGNFLRMVLGRGVFEGRRVLSERAVETMLTNQTGDVPIRRSACQPYVDLDPEFAESRYGVGCWLERIDPETGLAAEATSAGAFGCVPFVDRQRNIAGVFLPRHRSLKLNSQWQPYNDTAAVFLELRPIIRKVFDAAKSSSQKSAEPRVDAPVDENAQSAGAAPGPHRAESIDPVTLQDAKRDKRLQVRVTYPAANGPHPVIVFSHFVGGAREDYRPLVEHWVSHGYVCLQADHSDSRSAAERGPRLDWRNRAEDMRLVLDSLEAIEGRSPALRGKLDRQRIGAGGHLIGAYAASLLVGMKVFPPGDHGEGVSYRDRRVEAALMLSPQGRGQGLTEKSWEGIDRPILVAAGSETVSRRTGNPAEWRTDPYRFASPGRKYLLWIEGLDNAYGGLVIGRQVDPPVAGWIKQATLAFWDAHLKADREARSFLVSKAIRRISGGKARIESSPGKEG